MNKKTYPILLTVLAIGLLASNLWWFLQVLDQASIEKYHDQMLYERLEAMEAAHTVIPSLTAGLSRREVIKRVESAIGADPSETFEKDGWVVVGPWVHLRFTTDGKLAKVGPGFR